MSMPARWIRTAASLRPFGFAAQISGFIRSMIRVGLPAKLA